MVTRRGCRGRAGLPGRQRNLAAGRRHGDRDQRPESQRRVEPGQDGHEGDEHSPRRRGT
ncbi:UNVERIFIED_CONTAM: hypothetical protein GTU68_050376 [Idotea baltica]|nr:hypothetical protein [Idotea baltica]